MTDYYGRRTYDKCIEVQRDVKRIDDAQKANHKALTASFNRMAEAIEGLTREVQNLRADLGPQSIDKPKKLPTPARGE